MIYWYTIFRRSKKVETRFTRFATLYHLGLEMLMLVNVIRSMNSNIIKKVSKDLILIVGEDEL
jgi:hypothetical protein